MKQVCIIILAMALFQGMKAQGVKEWLSQKQTQTQYLIQQIAALQVYIGYLQKGYKIVQGGLNTIGNIKKGHFNLDKAFFDGLKSINPKVKSYARVADIITLNIQVIQRAGKALKEAHSSDRFTGNELDYVSKVFTGITDGCSELIEALTQLLTLGDLQLSDDERIKRIDGVYAEMKDRYGFINGFCNDLTRMRLQRSQELRDAGTMQKLSGL